MLEQYKDAIVDYLIDCEGFTQSDAYDTVRDNSSDITAYWASGESPADAASYLL